MLYEKYHGLLGMGNRIFDDTTIMINGRIQFRIENYRSILLYSDTIIRIQANNYQVSICGKNLRIRYYDKDEMEVFGQIDSVSMT